MHNLRTIKSVLICLLLLHIFAAVYFTRELVLPIMIGIIIALTFSPLVRLLTRNRIPQAVSAFAIVISLGTALSLVVVLVAAPVSNWLTDLPQLEAEIRAKISGLSSSVEAVRDVAEQVEDIAEEATEGDQPVQRVAVDQPQFLTSAASGVATVATTMAISLVLALFFLASNDLIVRKLSRMADTAEQRHAAIGAIHDVEKGISRYLLAITAINAGLGLCVGLSLWALGLNNAWIWGIIAFLLNFIPFLGAVLGSIAVFAIAIIQFDTLAHAALAPVIYMTLSSIEGQFVTPSLVGRRMKINAVSVILTVFVWGWLWGVPGIIIAVPFLVIIKAVADNVPSLNKVAVFLSDDSEQKA
ncbi:AI-2E family transporter [Pseudooctadecabacter jejudonensis]|uniref:AI-2 transport protein TqsA n=1 Tax=Pseudooctadecabacter jejudonensis TaxID=1391910 RepID=A0A1Y5S7A0_9RHOB|nr:AI-2E family transporter [Pseudooctadecabacter jejudonensis]SLN33988.1 AI-2 transport protein TqsA [Pseudooctadecabacter jejudonensis]